MKINLSELRSKNLPVCTLDMIFTENPDKPLSEIDRETLNKYFSIFTVISKNEDKKGLCVGCGLIMQGGITGFLMSGSGSHTSLEWGLANGEAFCSHCQYPYKVYHRNVGGDLIEFLELALPYHPDILKEM